MMKAMDRLRAANRIVAMVAGVALLLTALFVLLEITLRALHLPNLGGADEISGYIMAAVTAWGLLWA